MKIHIQHGDIHLIDLRTRLLFKYGIATMRSAPHAFVRLHVEVDGQPSIGIAADHLPPKWFTKDADRAVADEIDEMLWVIEHAVELAAGLRGDSAYDVWRQLHDAQDQWGREAQLPPLLSGFGTTLVERALIEATAKTAGQSFSEAVRSDLLGIRLGEWDRRLEGTNPASLLPSKPCKRVVSRQTIGMADSLTDGEILPAERLDDGLPQSLAQSIKRYGLRHFKVKVSGELEHDVDRLWRISAVIAEHATADFAFTVDGNEQFLTLDAFREYWRRLSQTESLQSFFAHLLFVEQPFHRDVALDVNVLAEMRSWSDRPAMIIDESNAELDSLPRALELGYQGTSYKSCKGVFKGVANACLLERLRQTDPQAELIISSEDLVNIGPVALLQDLAVAASLGITSIERNGHHYFAGLSAFPATVWQQVLDAHGELYQRAAPGWPTLNIHNGQLDLGSVIEAPLGVGFELDVEQFASVEQWRRTRRTSEEG